MAAVVYRVRPLEQRLSIEDYRRAARRRVPGLVWEFVWRAARTISSRSSATARPSSQRWTLRTRAMTGRPRRSLRRTIAGVELELPVLLAPTGALGLSYWRGDVAAARAAEAGGTRLVLSTSSSWTIEEVAEATHASHFFQLYPGGEHTAALMARARHAGYGALFVTVDVPVIGNREGERRRGYTRQGAAMGSRAVVLSPREAIDVARHPRWLYQLYRHRRAARCATCSPRRASGRRSSRSEILHREIERASALVG